MGVCSNVKNGLVRVSATHSSCSTNCCSIAKGNTLINVSLALTQIAAVHCFHIVDTFWLNFVMVKKSVTYPKVTYPSMTIIAIKTPALWLIMVCRSPYNARVGWLMAWLQSRYQWTLYVPPSLSPKFNHLVASVFYKLHQKKFSLFEF